MLRRNPRLSGRGLIMLAALVVLVWIGCGTRCAAQDEGLLTDCLDGDCGDLIMSLVAQSEADSLRIKELEIRLFWANERVGIAKSERPNWLERFMSKYGFAIGAAVGVYCGAAAAR